jgi:23S rRNA (uracil1939-C5)-methyltransferase
VLPGEVVEIEAYSKEKSHYVAEKFEVVETSEFRRDPICDYYEKCGGCSLQHIKYEKQLEIKKDIFTELLKQNGIELNVEPEIVTPGETGLRTRAKVFVKHGKPAFRAYHSNELVTFDNCPLLHPEFMDRILEEAPKNSGDVQYEFSKVTKDFMPPMDSVRKTVNGREITILRNSFFQSSEDGAQILCSLLENEIQESKPETGYDLFCGSGLFSIFMTEMGVKTTGMEVVPEAVKSYRLNLGDKAQIKQVDAYQIKKLEQVDIVVADPPRNGLGLELIDIIAESEPNAVVYISCEPSKFARDMKRFVEKNYKLEKIVIVDLFPSTHHFEVFSVFRKA